MNSKLSTGKNLHVNNTINSRKQQKQMQCTKKKLTKANMMIIFLPIARESKFDFKNPNTIHNCVIKFLRRKYIMFMQILCIYTQIFIT